MRWILLLAIVCGCAEDGGIADLECSAQMLDSQGGVYPTKPEGGCFPGLGDESRVGPDDDYEGEPWCPGAEPGGPATCPLPLPDGCIQP